MKRLGFPFAGFLLLLGFCPVRAETPPTTSPPDPAKIATLINQLGDSKYRIRESATSELIRLGRAARESLLQAKDHPDEEIASRARRILPQALMADLEVRLSTYLKDKDHKEKHDLPFLDLWTKTCGDDDGSRELFGKVVKFGGLDLIRLEMNPTQIQDDYVQRFFTVNNRNQNNVVFKRGGEVSPVANQMANLEEISLFFLLGCDARTAEALKQPNLWPNFLYQPTFVSSISRTDAVSQSFRKLFVGWMNQRKEPNVMNQCLNIIQQHKIKEGIPLATRIMNDTGGTVYMRAMAMTAVGRIGDRGHLALFEPLLKTDTVVTPFNFGGNNQGNVQIADIALAMTIQLSGQSAREFDFPMLKQNQGIDAFQYYYLGFEDDTKRNAARKKWEEFVVRAKKVQSFWAW